jgi:hypothetical protein
MDAKTRDLALLAGLSLFSTGVAWIWGYVILGSVFFALGGVAALGLAENHWRWLGPANPQTGGGFPPLRDGDRINAVLAAAGYNFILLLRWRLAFRERDSGLIKGPPMIPPATTPLI